MKKTYTTPEMETMVIQCEGEILAGGHSGSNLTIKYTNPWDEDDE